MMLGVAVLPFLGQSLLPDFKERDFLMHWLTKPGTGHEERSESPTPRPTELPTIPGVRNVGAHIGQALAHGRARWGSNSARTGSAWIPSADYDQTVASIQEVVDGYPGLFSDVLTYLKERIREVLTGTSQAITIRIYGRISSPCVQKAKEVNAAPARESRASSRTTWSSRRRCPRSRSRRTWRPPSAYGLKPGDVRRAAGRLIAGKRSATSSGTVGPTTSRCGARPRPATASSDIENLSLDTPTEEYVRLNDVADVDRRRRPT